LSAEQSSEVLKSAAGNSMRTTRDHAILAMRWRLPVSTDRWRRLCSDFV